MTFTEAAVEVLRLMGKPLHYKKITEVAIERNLLSHVGKTPETTMSSRLATMVKKDRGDAPIIKVKPGVFALREFSDQVVEDDGEQDAQDMETTPDHPPPERVAPDDEEESLDLEVEVTELESENAPAADLPGVDVFPEEEDDDELILANLDEPTDNEGRGRRRTRGRRRRERGKAAEPARGTTATTEGDWSRVAGQDELAGRDLADAIEAALRTGGRQPKSLRKVAEILIQGGRLTGSAADLGPTLAAATRGDNARRRADSLRPRFRETGGMLGLLEWELPLETVKAEADAVRAAERQRDSVHRALTKRLRDLPAAPLMELLATWLNAVGVHSLRGVRSSAGDFGLAGTLRRGPEETPVAIAVYKGNRPLGADAVVELRGALHRFDQARVAWIVSLGQVRNDALEEARAEGAVPCALFDGKALAASMEAVGVGIRRTHLPLAVLDVDLFESLQGPRPSVGHAQEASAQDSPTETNGSRRRRGRRRGRRRTSREEVASADNQTDSQESEAQAAGEVEPEPAPSDVEQQMEAPEDTEKPVVDITVETDGV